MKEKYALITGATSGIGYELAKRFAAEGYNLVLVALHQERLQEVKEEFQEGNRLDVFCIQKDLFRPGAAKEIYDEVSASNIEIDVLVNDAGQGEWGKFTDIDLQRSLDIIQLNVSSLVSLTWYFLKDMVKRNSGRILQLGSEVSKSPAPLLNVYAATKAFVLSFSEALINELKDTDVTVTVLMPGATDTDFFHRAGAEHTVNYREKDLADPVDVANAGFEALMAGERRVIVGAGAKSHVAMATVMPDNISAANLRKSLEPSEKENGRVAPAHEASLKERAID